MNEMKVIRRGIMLSSILSTMMIVLYIPGIIVELVDIYPLYLEKIYNYH